jgi:hypothetical protein
MTDLSITNLGGDTNASTSTDTSSSSIPVPVNGEQHQPERQEGKSGIGPENNGAGVPGNETGLPANVEQSNPYAAELDAAERRLRELITPPWKISPYVKAHLYGRPGSHKTITACNNGLRTLFIDIEEGALSLNNHPDIAKNVEVIPFQSYKQMQVLIEVMQSGRMDEFKVVVFDTWSELAKEETDRAFAGMTNAKAIANRPHAELAGGTDYQLANENMRKLAVSLRGLDKHIVFVSHLKEEKDKAGVITRIRPNLSPGLTSTMEGFVSFLGYMSAEYRGTMGVVCTLQTQPGGIIDAKTTDWGTAY